MRRLLCIDTGHLPTAPTIQRNVKGNDLLTNHICYKTEDEISACPGVCPLSFSLSVRSSYTNKVLGYLKDGHVLYYKTQNEVSVENPLPYFGYDLPVYFSSLGVYSFLMDRATEEVLRLLQLQSYQPIGFYNPAPGMFNPIMYSHVVFTDEGFEQFSHLIADDIVVHDISSMQKEGNIAPLLDTLFEIHKEAVDT